MALTPTDIKTAFPEFNLVADSRVEMSILEATIIMGDDVERWQGQSMYYAANQYLIAHLVYVAQGMSLGDSNPLAPVKDTAVDNVEVAYAISSVDGMLDSEFGSTSYGRRFIFYRNMCFTGGICV